jgi:hypothetical protein
MLKFSEIPNLLDVTTQYVFWEIVDLFKQAEILPEQNFGYYGRKPNISR